MQMQREPMEQTLAHGDGSVRFTLPPNSVMTGPYDPGGYILRRGDTRWRAYRLKVEGDQVEVQFPQTIAETDEIDAPEVDIAEEG